jgi:hypothetical protein
MNTDATTRKKESILVGRDLPLFFLQKNFFVRWMLLLVLWEMFLVVMWNDSGTLSSYMSLSSGSGFRFLPFVPG